MSLPKSLVERLSLPLVAAPMFQVSGPELVVAACQAGVIGSFPTINAGNLETLDKWLQEITDTLKRLPTPYAPWCPNLIMQRDKQTLFKEVECLIEYSVELVITSVGSPRLVIKSLHAADCLVFADVASLEHARKAVNAGVDGLILLTAGAGGQTGWANGFAFVRAIKQFYHGPIILAGGISDGTALWSALNLGCDLGYMGTKFIATNESMASQGYRSMLVASDLDQIILTSAFTGLPTNMLKPSISAAGIDLAALDDSISQEQARSTFGSRAPGPHRWTDLWSAGHSVSNIAAIYSVAELIANTKHEYHQAIKASGILAQAYE